MLRWMLRKLNLDERFQLHFFFFRQGTRNLEYDDWFLFHRDTWQFLLRGQGRETEAAGEIETQRTRCHLSFGGREWGYVLCGGAMHLFSLCYLGPRQMVWLSKHVCVCDMQILLGLHAYLNPSLREYSCTVNILLMMECVCVRVCACVCVSWKNGSLPVTRKQSYLLHLRNLHFVTGTKEALKFNSGEAGQLKRIMGRLLCI